MKRQATDLRSQKALRFLRRVSGQGDSGTEVTGTRFPPPEFDDDMWQVRILSSLIERVYLMHLRPRHGLPVLEWQVVEAAGHHPGVSAVQLINYWAYDKTTVGRAIQRLKRAGLVQTRPDATDRRRTGLYLTRKGQAVFAAHTEAKLRFRSALDEIVPPEEVHAATVTLRRLIEHFRTVLEVSR